MILLKEFPKETGKEDIGQGCSDYSQLFSGWHYGNLQAFLRHQRWYVPKVAIVFKKAGRGVAFV